MEQLAKRSLIECRKNEAYDEWYRIHLLLHDLLKSFNDQDKRKVTVHRGTIEQFCMHVSGCSYAILPMMLFQKLHQDFVNCYLAKANGQWHALPRDGYIHDYLAYHFYRSGNNADIPWNIFLDLRFMIVQLQECGPIKILRDYQRYGCFIRQKVC